MPAELLCVFTTWTQWEVLTCVKWRLCGKNDPIWNVLSGYTLYRLPARQICSTCILAIGGKRERQLCEEATCRFFECQAGEQLVPLIRNFRFFIQHSWKVVSYRIEYFLEVCLRVENLSRVFFAGSLFQWGGAIKQTEWWKWWLRQQWK